MSLTHLFYDPRTGLSSAAKFIVLAKQHGFKNPEILDFLKRQTAVQMNRDRRKGVFFPEWGRGWGSYQMDLFFPEGLNGETILTIINVNSRKLYAYRVKGKGTDAVYDGLKEWLGEVVEKPFFVQSDNEKAFKAPKVKNLFKEHNIEQNFVEPGDHRGQGMVERIHETLRRLFKMYETATHKSWKGAFKDLVWNYNHRIQRSIGQAPWDATQDAGMAARQEQYARAAAKYTLKVGDKVRLSISTKNPFKKGRDEWSREVWTITGTNGFHRYTLDDPKHSSVMGYDLQLVEGEPEVAPKIVSPPLDKEPGRKAKKVKRTLNKEGVKDFLTAGPAEVIQSNKRQAKTPEEFVAEPSNRKALKLQREVELAKVKKRGANIPKYVQKYENNKWIRGKVIGDQVKFLDGSTSPFSLELLKSKALYKFPLDKADNKALPKLLPQLAEL